MHNARGLIAVSRRLLTYPVFLQLRSLQVVLTLRNVESVLIQIVQLLFSALGGLGMSLKFGLLCGSAVALHNKSLTLNSALLHDAGCAAISLISDSHVAQRRRRPNIVDHLLDLFSTWRQIIMHDDLRVAVHIRHMPRQWRRVRWSRPLLPLKLLFK